MSSSYKRVFYVYDETLANATNKIPHLNLRSSMVHELLKSYGLLDAMEICESKEASREDLLTFHSSSYLAYLEESDFNWSDDTSYQLPVYKDEANKWHDFEEDFGIGYDCPSFPRILDFCRIIAGGTLTAAKLLVNNPGVNNCAINWCGGWHHAQRNEASGFCYVNDIVIGIQYLLQSSVFKKVLYIDLDAHHGDGVDNAFSFTDKVMTVSFHNYEVGYFPGTGKVEDVGSGRGRFYSLNVPLKSGITDDQYIHLVKSVLSEVKTAFETSAIVVQCGADCLSGDPLGNFNLTEKSLVEVIRFIGTFKKPTLYLGGGGYNIKNTAKLWTLMTSAIIQSNHLGLDIPDHKYFLQYGPDYTLNIPPGLRSNENSSQSLHNIISKISNHLCNLRNS